MSPKELGERSGDTVGYRVRLEEVAGQNTRLFFVTEGVLLRRMLSDPELAGVGVVVLDEFHERHLDTDLLLQYKFRIPPTLTFIGWVQILPNIQTTHEERNLGKNSRERELTRREGDWTFDMLREATWISLLRTFG